MDNNNILFTNVTNFFECLKIPLYFFFGYSFMYFVSLLFSYNLLMRGNKWQMNLQTR